ncbi:mitochondrial ribonuclease P protein 1 homolog [Babylonia areolata]|uniref:mitochondrial ribonuclease P protein 1 homolog n=1 Tax=Babylonia areolata TaxID=304850 RepID=UPI003FD092C0
MASWVTARTKLSALMRLLPLTTDSFLPFYRASVSHKLQQDGFRFIIDQPRTFFHTMKTSPQILTASKPCSCSRKPKCSSAPLRVPQVDLDSEVERKRTSEIKVGVQSATEVLQNLSPEDARKLKIIKLEFDVTEQMNGKVPEVMTDENWLHALKLDSKSQRLRYYIFLRKVEMLKKSRKRKQETKQELKQREKAEAADETEPVYKNTIFFTIRETTLKKAGNYRLAHALQFGQPLVFDMDYEQYMRSQDCQNLVFQLLLSYSRNREAREPFHFFLTSLDPRGRVLRMLQRQKLVGSNFLGTMTDQSYLDLFPRKNLVYLSPHASDNLKDVSADDVYIIGGIVDKINTSPFSLARAKEQGIRVAKFPLDNYLLWGSGSKSLTLDQVTTILLEQQRSKDWNEAFKAIPRRKLYRDD